jgi:hypothetical protein
LQQQRVPHSTSCTSTTNVREHDARAHTHTYTRRWGVPMIMPSREDDRTRMKASYM